MVFDSRNKLQQKVDMLLLLNNEVIERVDTFKYLGLIIDRELTFEDYISYAYQKACSTLTALRTTRLCLNKGIALKLYKSLTLPQLD